ncbi:MAG: hypothetical protein WC547_02660 [Candidatus Omnitrophota bacterium]
MDKSIEPKKVSDVLDNAESYIAEMRQKQDKVTIPQELKQYIWIYFRNADMTKAIMEKLACFSVDKIYRVASVLTMADEYTFAFFAGVMPKLWDSLQDRGIDTFYILDNAIREDRFNLIVNLFRVSGFCVVTPYFDTTNKDVLKTEKEKTVHIVMDPPLFYDYCSLEAVEAQINKYMSSTQNIAYIEADSRVNYLDKVMEMGKKSKYLCIFRNEAPTDSRVQIVRSNYPHSA